MVCDKGDIEKIFHCEGITWGAQAFYNLSIIFIEMEHLQNYKPPSVPNQTTKEEENFRQTIEGEWQLRFTTFFVVVAYLSDYRELKIRIS